MTASRWRIQTLDVTASTNDVVRRAAASGEAEGLVIHAHRQSSGRGRQGRVWESPAGNMYCSFLLRPNNTPQSAGLYSFVAALAVRDAVSQYLPMHAITLKWPNDVLVDGKKISGILLEVEGDALIVGIGINVAHCPDNALYPTTSLKVEGVEVDTSNLLNHLLDSLSHWHDTMQAEGFEPIRTAWLQHAKKGRLIVRLQQETLQGEFMNIDELGRLRLQLEGGAERAISTGDVFFAPKE